MTAKEQKKPPEDIAEEAPSRAAPDPDALRGVASVPEGDGRSVPSDQSGRVETDEHYGEGEDNPYQESDEALPDDAEEATLTRNNAREGGRFDEV